MSDYIEDLVLDIRSRMNSQPNNERRSLRTFLSRFSVRGWLRSYLALLLRRWVAPTLALSGMMALAISTAGWSSVPNLVWIAPPILGLLAAGGYAYRDKPAPRSPTVGQIAIWRRNTQHDIAELRREQVHLLDRAQEQADALIRREDLNHLLAHCEYICTDVAIFDEASANGLRDAAARIPNESIGGWRGSVTFPSAENPPALLVARNLGGWIAAATDIVDVFAPPTRGGPLP